MRFVMQLSIHVPARTILAPLWRQRLVLRLYRIDQIWRGLRTPGSRD